MAASAWRLRRGGELDQFFTNDTVGRALVAMIGDCSIRSVLDLGSGTGALSTAALSRWPTANLVSVDLDAEVAAPLKQHIAGLGCGKHEHYVHDVFDEHMPQIIGGGGFDLAVCNPPFIRPVWRPGFAKILQAAGMADACQGDADITAEMLFLAQNLRLVRDRGMVALIVPNGIAVGHKYRRFRQAIMSKHTIKSVAQLPAYSFERTEAHCFILLIEKGIAHGSAPVTLTTVIEGLGIGDEVKIDAATAAARMDYNFHSSIASNDPFLETLRSLGAEVRRGSFSSVERRLAGFPVFHTGDFLDEPSHLSLPLVSSNRLKEKAVIAEPGDILLARVDRHLHNKIAYVQAGRSPITDCIFRIRLPREHAERVFANLVTMAARERIRATVKGVGARVLGKGDLLDLPLIEKQSVAT